MKSKHGSIPSHHIGWLLVGLLLLFTPNVLAFQEPVPTVIVYCHNQHLETVVLMEQSQLEGLNDRLVANCGEGLGDYEDEFAVLLDDYLKQPASVGQMTMQFSSEQVPIQSGSLCRHINVVMLGNWQISYPTPQLSCINGGVVTADLYFSPLHFLFVAPLHGNLAAAISLFALVGAVVMRWRWGQKQVTTEQVSCLFWVLSASLLLFFLAMSWVAASSIVLLGWMLVLLVITYCGIPFFR